jgi:hypothetical protein
MDAVAMEKAFTEPVHAADHQPQLGEASARTAAFLRAHLLGLRVS